MPEETVRLRMIGKFDPQPLEQIVDREIDLFRVDVPGLELVDVEERVQHAHQSVRCLVEPGDQLQGLFVLFVLDLLRQDSPHQAESLQRLPQVTTATSDPRGLNGASRSLSMNRGESTYGSAARMARLKRSTWPVCNDRPGATRDRQKRVRLFDRRGDRLLDQHVQPALERRRRHGEVRRRRHHDAHRLDLVEQRLQRRERLHAASSALTLCGPRLDSPRGKPTSSAPGTSRRMRV